VIAMRGADERSSFLFSYVSPEQRVPPDHPLRVIRLLVDEVLTALSSRFDRLYSDMGRPSIPPEQLLRALVLQALYTVRSERLLIEQLDYNLLFRWFVGLGMDEPIWDHSTFSKNRARLLEGEMARAFFAAVLADARTAQLLSDDHFSVDGTLLEAWAGQKSVRRRDQGERPPEDRGNPSVDFRGERRTNETHRSTTDPDARLAKRAPGQPARLAYAGHLCIDNRHGLVVDAMVTPATGLAEVDAALRMAERLPPGRVTIGADTWYDQRRFVTEMRHMGITPHVAQYPGGHHRRSAIDRRTTRHPGYAVSQRARKRIEEVFGWMKTIGLLRKLRHRGGPRVHGVFTFTAAVYNLVRMRALLTAPA
jgi:transposase